MRACLSPRQRGVSALALANHREPEERTLPPTFAGWDRICKPIRLAADVRPAGEDPVLNGGCNHSGSGADHTRRYRAM